MENKSTTKIQDSFPLPNIKNLKRVKGNRLGAETFKVQGNRFKGMTIEATYAQDNLGDRWLRVRLQWNKDITKGAILFAIRNFYAAEDEVFQRIAPRDVDPNEAWLYANIDAKIFMPTDEVIQEFDK